MTAEWVAAIAAVVAVVISVPMSIYAVCQSRLAMSVGAPVPSIATSGHEITVSLRGDADKRWEIFRLELTDPDNAHFMTTDKSDRTLPYLQLGRSVNVIPSPLLISRYGPFEIIVHFRLVNERYFATRSTAVRGVMPQPSRT